MNLYELTGATLELQELILNGADEELFADTLESLEMSLEDKAVGYAKIMRNIESQIARFKEEEKRLADKRKPLENKVKNMKENLQNSFLALDIKRIDTELFNFNVQNNPPKINILDEKAIPQTYFIEQPKKLDRKQLLSDAKSGSVDGVEVVQEKSLRIK